MREIGAEDKGDITDINDEHKGNMKEISETETER
jgi:hypothetical protein